MKFLSECMNEQLAVENGSKISAQSFCELMFVAPMFQVVEDKCILFFICYFYFILFLFFAVSRIKSA